MLPDINATEAVRNFSELLNNIKYRGHRYRILRGGKPAAALIPLDEPDSPRILADLYPIFKTLPHLDPDDLSFADDTLEVIAAQPSLPGSALWE